MIEQRIIEEVQYHGGHLRVVGGRLQLRTDQPLPNDLFTMLQAHKAGVARRLDPSLVKPCRLPPLPKSVRACLDYFGRHPDKDLTPKLHGWLDKDWARITKYEKGVVR